MVEMSAEMQAYFKKINDRIKEMYDIANAARGKGLDPSTKPEVNVASDIAGRVEELIGPPGIAKKIRELSKVKSRDHVAFEIAEEIVNKTRDESIEKAADLAIRCALAIKTEGVVSAPLEGISKIVVKEYQGSKYLSIYFAGPIRAAGGTTQAYVVLLADHIRKRLGLDKYIPSAEEVARYIEEIGLYKRIVNLQYSSTYEELEWVISHIPVEITGEQTNPAEVSAHRNLPRVETNSVRGGACLVINDGVLAKAAKLLKLIDELNIDGWDWLKHIPKEGHHAGKDSGAKDKKFGDDMPASKDGGPESNVANDKKVKPKSKYIAEVIAGRPIFSHPAAHGGFRVRYGRSRNMGLAAYGFHPATMYVTGNFIAVGTQLRVERPGKSTVAMPVDSIEGPIVRLKNGDVIRIESEKTAVKINDKIDKILFIGDVLIGFGEFLENNHVVMPSGYCEEWWILEVEKSMKEKYIDTDKLASLINEDSGRVKVWLEDYFYSKPTCSAAIAISKVLDVPLHPRYTYFWGDMKAKDLVKLREWLLDNGEIKSDERWMKKLTCKQDPEIKSILEYACIPHVIDEDSYDFLDNGLAIIETLGLERGDLDVNIDDTTREKTALSLINKISSIKIRDKAPYFMGLRMGRPEKAKERKMNPPVHVLFPLGHDAGGQRLLQNAIKKRTINVEIANKYCPQCNLKTILNLCPKCKVPTVFYSYCPRCKIDLPKKSSTCPKCGVETQLYSRKKVNMVSLYHDALKRVNLNIPNVKGVKGMSSKFKVPEPLEKGLLRAKYEVYVYKDGTIRFDTGDAPLTHFTPREIHVSVDDLKTLGYEKDINGKPLKNPDQILELKVQDILLPKSSLKYFYKVSKFIDELLERVYKLPPYYNISNYRDFLGHLVIGLAPHTSAGVVGRIIGFSTANVGYAHPVFHAAKRRNCDGDEDGLLLFLDVILNFSRFYLPAKTGAKMDTPLVISNQVVPDEVDSEAHNIDVVWKYPLEFYEKSFEYPEPKKMKNLIETIKQRLGTKGQYEGLGFTHPTRNINEGPKTTTYKELKTMEDKLRAQFKIGSKIAAVDQADQAMRVLKSHFTPDIMGNLRAFGTQEFRCSKCNEKYHRPPLAGKCKKCGNQNLTLTVSPGSIKKYLDISLEIVKTHSISPYTRQKMEILAEKVESTIFNGKKKQMALSQFF
ncbi:MAG: DNA polymerase II large subunit [Promethearchaeota archaeon]